MSHDQQPTAAGFHGYESPRAAAAANQARVGALISAIGHLSELLEDSAGDAKEAFYLATAIQACVECAHRDSKIAQAALDAMREAGYA